MRSENPFQKNIPVEDAMEMAGEQGAGLEDPQIQQLTGTEDASPEEEQQLGEALVTAKEFMYSEKGLAAIANVFQQDDRQLWQTIPEVGTMILEKVHGEMPGADGSIFFGENGLLQQMPVLLFEIAEQLGVPGYDDPDQLAAATMGLYKSVGEYLTERGDEDAMREAQRLGQEVLLTQDDGSMMAPVKMGEKMAKIDEPQMKQVAGSVKQGLLGV